MRRQLGFGLILLTSLIVSGCGGGSSGGSSSGGSISNIAKTGSFSLAFSGGAAPGVKHAWLTVYKVAFNGDADRPWDPADSTWKIVTLTSPVTIDMAAAAGFVVGSAGAGVTVPVGTYNQIRLFLSPHDDTASVPSGLTYKAQLDYDTTPVRSVPIEIPNVQSGLKLDRGVIIEANTWSVITTHIDVDRSIVRFNGDGVDDAVTMRPRTFTYGFSPTTTGTIQGAIDPVYVCGAATGARSDCATDITVSLYAPSSDGDARMENWGTVKVNPKRRNAANTADVNDGTFELGPLSSVGGNPSSYDLVIRGRGMKTMVVKNIAYGLLANYVGCSWSVAAGNTADASTLIRPVPDASPRTVSLSPSLALKTGRVGLSFTLSAGGKPYEVHAANTDPFTGALTAGSAMSVPSLASGGLLVSDYPTIKAGCTGNSPPGDLAIAFDPVVALEGVGGFTPFALGTFYTSGKLGSTPFTSGSTFSVDEPTVASASTGRVSVSITGLPAAGATKAQLIVSDVGGMVLTRDIHSSCSTSPCTEAVTLPAGTVSNGAATGVYEFAVRYWDATTTTTAKSAVEAGGTMKWARASTFVNLRSASSGTVAITVP